MSAPEHWSIDAGEADVALLDVPPAEHERVFEVDCRCIVRATAGAGDAWFELSVELDGRRQWSRRIAVAPGAPSDSLDYRCRREVAAGEPLRIRAAVRVGSARRERLVIEASEQRED